MHLLARTRVPFGIASVTILLAIGFGLLGSGTARPNDDGGAAIDEQTETWRSVLYPADWTPDMTDADGRFLHDFSYAGYRMGEAPIPTEIPGETYAVEGADPTGEADSTEAIQAALDAAGEAGGGLVQLPAGTYRVSRSAIDRSACLWIRHSGVVLRGSADPDAPTRLYCDDPAMRRAAVIGIGSGSWTRPVGDATPIAERLPNRATEVPLESVEGLAVGQWIVLRSDVTEAFIEAHGMTGWWSTRLPGPMFYRRITAIDAEAGRITIDIPTRYPLETRDNARVHRCQPHLAEIGVEELEIGMRCEGGDGFGDSDYRTEGTGAHRVHGSHLIAAQHIVDSWIQRVRSYRPAANDRNWHLQSNGIRLNQCRNVTVRDCTIARPQYEGGGGNGYGFILRANDCLVTGCLAISARHAYDFKSMYANGNVIHDSESRDAHLPSDFHMHLSMSNLFDSMRMDGDFLEARVRPYGTIIHGHPTTQSVFWNTTGVSAHRRSPRNVVISHQFGHGYVIGTQGEVTGIQTTPTRDRGRETAPEDHVEGEGRGATLEPASLYDDQLARRLAREAPDAADR